MAIHLSHHDEIALITLDRPEALNAWSFGQLHDLNRILDSIADSPARALLVTGAGDRAFSAGADIKELMGRTLVEQRSGAMLGQSLQSLQATQDTAAGASQALATGQATDPTAVVMAVERAQLAMQLASQIRTKAVEAAQDIFHTQV